MSSLLWQVADRTARLAAEKQRQIDLDAAMEVERQKAVVTQEVRMSSTGLRLGQNAGRTSTLC